MTTAGRTLETAVEELFDGSANGSRRVGLERELIAYRHGDVGTPVPVRLLRSVLAGVPDVDFEPGGQVELHPAPAATAATAVRLLRERERAARSALATVGVHLAAVGLDPWRRPERVGLQLTDHRYRAMDRHFARIGPAGRRFMRQTAGLQVCVDLRKGREGVVQWRAANLVAPVLAGLFANSRVSEGRRLPTASGRTVICLATDPHRMAYGRLGRTADAVGEYVRYAADAPPLSDRLSGIGDRLSTLFPAVRPRGGYLELRSLDSVAAHDLDSAVALTTALLAVPGVDDQIVGALDGIDLPRLWSLAAGPGLGHPEVRGIAEGLVRLARSAAADLPADYLPPDAPGLGRLERRLGVVAGATGGRPEAGRGQVR